MTGPYLRNPNGRIARFDADARAIVQYLQQMVPELQSVEFTYASMPGPNTAQLPPSEMPKYYAIDRARRMITLFRIPIQRARVLHVDDAEHRRFFIGHCAYRAACEYLGRSPWDLLPGQFEHY